MLPEDLLRYCQTNHLLDSVLGRGDPAVNIHSGSHASDAAVSAAAASAAQRPRDYY